MPAKRGRPRKKVVKSDPVELIDEPQEQPLVIEDHVVTKRYRTKRPLDIDPTEDAEAPLEPEREADFTPEEIEEDRLMHMFKQEGGDSGVAIKVFKLLDSSGKLKSGNFVYCGKIQLSEDYLGDIQSQFGGGNYRLHLIKDGLMASVRMVSIAQTMQYDPSKPTTTVQHGQALHMVTGQAQAPQVPQVPPVGGLEGLKQALEIYKDVRKLVEPPALVQKQAEPTNGNISVTHAMLRLIEDDERALAQVQRRLFGAETAGTDWAGVIEKGMAMLPMLMQGIGGMMGKPGAPAPTSEPQRSPLIGPNLEQFYMRLLDAMAAASDINTTAVELAAIARTDPQVLNILDAMTRESIAQIFASLAQAPQFMPALTHEQRGALQRPQSDVWLDGLLTRVSELLFPDEAIAAPAPQVVEGPPDANIN